jgi:inner membrane protein
MDNICHSLVGACLGEAGLKRRTSLGMATLIIGANLPDIDVLALPLGHGLDFRRGPTHGVPALIVLPFLLAGAMVLWDRWRPRARPAPKFSALVLLSAISIWSHPFLDFLNTYGMRWLSPIDGTWFYGDTLFIVDLWVWLALGFGVFITRRRRRRTAPNEERPARLALASSAVYIAIMLVVSAMSRRAVAQGLGLGDPARRALAVGPAPANPFHWEILQRDGDRIRRGTFRWLESPRLVLSAQTIVTNANAPEARLAAATETGRVFLDWSRFPYFVIEPRGDSALVRMVDARYGSPDSDSWAALSVMVPAGGAANGGANSPTSP